jgi:hypothetical protein
MITQLSVSEKREKIKFLPDMFLLLIQNFAFLLSHFTYRRAGSSVLTYLLTYSMEQSPS